MGLRLLISGSKGNSNTVSSFIVQNFEPDIVYDLLTFHDQFSDLLKSPFFRVVHRLFPQFLIHKMDALFIRQVLEFRPDVVVVLKGMEISKKSLLRIRSLGVKLVNYNLDHPFVHFSRGTGNHFVTEAIPCYDLHITYSNRIASALSRQFCVQTSVIPFGYHLTDEQYEQVILESRPEINEVCFVGNPDVLRVRLLERLLIENVSVHVYGFGWEESLRPSPRLSIHPPTKADSYWSDPLDFWKVLRQYRVQLNFFRPHNEGSHNLRTFEVPAVGGLLLTPDSEVQRECFNSETEVFFYSDEETLIAQCKKIMSLDSASVNSIRANARDVSVRKDYSYVRRTRDLVAILKELAYNSLENT